MLVQLFLQGVRVVMFAPMLSVLFLAARIRALQLTRTADGKVPPGAGPQPWAQQAMFSATWALLMQYVAVCVAHVVLNYPGREKLGKAQGVLRIVGIVFDVIHF